MQVPWVNGCSIWQCVGVGCVGVCKDILSNRLVIGQIQ